MTYSQLFGLDESSVSEANFEAVFGGLHEGVLAGINNQCRVQASSPAAMTVEVLTGIMVSGGVFIQVTSTEILAIGANVSGNPRIDRVIVRRDNTTDTVTILVVQGIPGVAPTPPALTRAGGIYDISLAQVLVVNGAVQINAQDVWDERRDSTVCGMASGKVWDLKKKLDVWHRYPWGEWQGYGSATVTENAGLLSAATNTDNASAAVNDTDGIGLRQDTSNVAANDATTESIQGVSARQLNPAVEFKIKLSSIAAIRLFAGFAATTAATMVAADNPAAQCAGIQFSTDRGDTHWMYRCRDAGAGITLVDSGVAPTTNAVFLRVEIDDAAAAVIFTIFDANHNVIGSGRATTNLPSAATGLAVICGLETRTTTVKSITQYWARLVNQVV